MLADSEKRDAVASDPRVREIAARVRPLAQAAFGERFRRLVLFGSRARGEGREGDIDDRSDWDFAVIIAGPVRMQDRYDAADIANGFFADDITLDMHAVSPEDLERPFWLFHDIRTEGIEM
jgi:predicted nucleotidyltransferase